MKRKIVDIILSFLLTFDFFGGIFAISLLIDKFPAIFILLILSFLTLLIFYFGVLVSNMFTWEIDHKD